MLFDTDILIWYQRGNEKARDLIDDQEELFISAQTYMELLQCASSKKQLGLVRSFLRDLGFSVLPITENISHRASIYVEEYTLSHQVRAGDALIAATAIEHNFLLATGNAKHFRHIPGLELSIFKP